MKRSYSVFVEALEHRAMLTTLTIPATANPWIPAGSNLSGDTSPPVYTLPAGTGRVLKFSSVTGTINLNSSLPTNGPDSGMLPGFTTDISSVGGMSGIICTKSGRAAPLLAVFTQNSIPNSSPPARQDYANIAGASSFHPLLNQVFFVGDGKTGTATGMTQLFYVPNSATKLYLGIGDAGNLHGIPEGYYDNIGRFSATFTVSPQSGRVSGSVFNDANRNGQRNTGEAGQSGWMVYIDKNNNSQFDVGEKSVLTDAAGNYLLALTPGRYVVRVQVRSGFYQTSPHGLSHSVNVSAGGTASGKLFGVKAISPA